MASTMATMAVLNTKCLTNNSIKTQKPICKPVSFLNIPKGLINTNSTTSSTPAITSAVIAGAIFSSLGSVDPALAAQQIAEIAEGSGDNRGLALLLPLVPAIGWVLYNILQPGLNQINKMRSERAVIIGLGLSGLATSGFLFTSPQAQAIEEVARIAETSGSDNRGLLLLIVVLPAIGWVLFNILQPALNQINKMRS